MVSLPEDPSSKATYLVLETLRCGFTGPRSVLSWVTRRIYGGLAGGKILHARCDLDGGKDLCE
jgi:hypothetical protein